MKNDLVLETLQLSHRFAEGSSILEDIHLQVPAGSVYGFLGPNGAGKTTTLRLVLGLLKKQQGSIRVFGKSFDKHRIEILRKIGAMIESPSLYGHLTAVENLLVLQIAYQCPKERIGQVLEMVGLAKTGTKRTARFSLGMKQRLGIAMALLHEPDLLILDEPTNGLDPNGMIEIRELLLALNRQHGITIIISSHLLGEMEKMVSHVGIIHRGMLLFQGTLAELQKERKSSSRLIIKTGDQAGALSILHAQGLYPALSATPLIGEPPGSDPFSRETLSLPLPKPDVIAGLVRDLVGAGIDVYEISPAQNNLEALFMEMITH